MAVLICVAETGPQSLESAGCSLTPQHSAIRPEAQPWQRSQVFSRHGHPWASTALRGHDQPKLRLVPRQAWAAPGLR